MEEVWKDLTGFPDYIISNLGRIRSFRKNCGKKKDADGFGYLVPTLHYSGYLRVKLQNKEGKKREFAFHRLLYEVFVGLIPDKMEIDHRDHNPLNNDLDNLRLATRIQNARNRTKNSGREYKGICFVNGKWRSRGSLNRKNIHLGYFPTKKEAVEAYNKWAMETHGEFACLNIVEEVIQ